MSLAKNAYLSISAAVIDFTLLLGGLIFQELKMFGLQINRVSSIFGSHLMPLYI